jgi:ABC-type multidrug transport system fused ATPase/permease subunit
MKDRERLANESITAVLCKNGSQVLMNMHPVVSQYICSVLATTLPEDLDDPDSFIPSIAPLLEYHGCPPDTSREAVASALSRLGLHDAPRLDPPSPPFPNPIPMRVLLDELDAEKRARDGAMPRNAAGNQNPDLDRAWEADERRRRLNKPTSTGVWVPQAATVSVRGRPARAAGGRDVIADGLDLAYGGERLLEGASFVLAHGRRYGVVGRNGVGKSTLLRALARGDVPRPDGMRVVYVEQASAH